MDKSILEMARGAIIERADYEMGRIMQNIMDPNTKPTEKRKLTLTIEFSPDDDRAMIDVRVTAKSSLAAHLRPSSPAERQKERPPRWSGTANQERSNSAHGQV